MSKTRRRYLPKLALLLAGVLLAQACAPGLPKGVDGDRLQAAVDRAVGDDSTCVILSQVGTGREVWRAGLGHACRSQYSACLSPRAINLETFARDQARSDRPPVRTGCEAVSWASGHTPRNGLVWSAVMYGKRALPGMEIARRLDGVFEDAGL